MSTLLGLDFGGGYDCGKLVPLAVQAGRRERRREP